MNEIKVLDHGFVRLVSYMQPVPIEREITRHNEPEEAMIGLQSISNKQTRDLQNDVTAVQEWAHDAIGGYCAKAFGLYRSLLDQGVPRELARGILPLNTYSRMFATVDLHNLFHFLRLRLHSHAQYEIRVYAEALLQLIRPICPVAVEVFEESIKL